MQTAHLRVPLIDGFRALTVLLLFCVPALTVADERPPAAVYIDEMLSRVGAEPAGCDGEWLTIADGRVVRCAVT